MSRKEFNASWVRRSFDDEGFPGGNGLIMLASSLTAAAVLLSAAAIIFARGMGLLGAGAFALALFVSGGFLQPSSPKNKIWPILAGIIYGVIVGVAVLLLTNTLDSSIEFFMNLRP